MSCPVPSRSSTRWFRRVAGTVGAFSIVVTSAVIGLVAVAGGVAEAAATVDSTWGGDGYVEVGGDLSRRNFRMASVDVGPDDK